jgi:hypothetical protein
MLVESLTTSLSNQLVHTAYNPAHQQRAKQMSCTSAGVSFCLTQTRQPIDPTVRMCHTLAEVSFSLPQ